MIGLALILTASPAAAWEFSPLPICTLSHATETAEVTVTYDPVLPEPYAIAITRDTPWPDAPVFAMRFDGPAGLSISTDRHVVTDEGRTLTVTDRGFGNVLNGLEFNSIATAGAGGEQARFPLGNAAPEVRKFRDCTEGGIA
ncbi:MAG: hypothetical protein AAFR35_02800 [Pseudomonadota bacterium]